MRSPGRPPGTKCDDVFRVRPHGASGPRAEITNNHPLEFVATVVLLRQHNARPVCPMRISSMKASALSVGAKTK
jgi:hypothetical protein